MAGLRGETLNETRDSAVEQAESTERSLRWANWGSLFFALLQNICAAVMAISSVRLLIGLGSLAAAGGILPAMVAFHQDAIRIPMMALALVGAIANLYSVWRVRSLRARPASQWRVQPVSREKIRSENIQVALAILTIILLAMEWIIHWRIHGL
jgi:hypothetical protein